MRNAIGASRLKPRLLALTALLLASPLALADYAGQKTAEVSHKVAEQNPAKAWDLLWHEIIVDITIIGVIFAAVALYFMVKYRRRSEDEEGRQPKLTRASAIGWVLIPAFIFMADDFYLAAKGWDLWNKFRDIPEERMEVKLDAFMWGWEYTYPNGVKTFNQLKLPQGKYVILRMTSRDTLHSHYIPEYRIKEDTMPGRVTYIKFFTEKEGSFPVTCTEYCGLLHSRMDSRVTVMAPAEYDAWQAEEEARLASASNSQSISSQSTSSQLTNTHDNSVQSHSEGTN